jgi:protein involved in polysaccharide export with SLBB domain
MTFTKTYKGIFKPKNPQKYKGNVDNIIYRSLWERQVMNWLDDNVNVIEWQSEEVAVPYISPVDSRWHRYFPDFIAKMKRPDNSIITVMLEVKPAVQTREPKPSKRKTQKYITEVMTWGVNQAKWKYAQDYCNDRGWEFRLITEKELGLSR